ncbi:MAG: GNAT family N-acetyltransferase [Acidobacteriaceae bacterium]
MIRDINLLPIRPFSPDQDIPRVLSLLASVEEVDQGGEKISTQTLHDQLNQPGHDPLHDRWVIEGPYDSGTLVASAFIRLLPGSSVADANIIVHPEWRRLGIGGLMLDKILERARQIDANSVQFYANTAHPAAAGFLKAHGFVCLGAYTELRLGENVELPPIVWPFGYTLRPYSEVQDLSRLTEAMNLCYIPLWGHQEVSQEELAGWLPHFDPQGLFLVFSEKGRVVGISRVETSPDRSQVNGKPTGYIDAPGIVPQHRRLDLYRALVLAGICWLRDRGQELVEMESWGDKQEVLKMYRELGFKDLKQLACYELLLTSTDTN